MKKSVFVLFFVLSMITHSSPILAEEIDVFWLAEKGTPAQLKDALEKGAKFNVKRSIFDFDDDSDIDIDNWLFESGETPLHRAAAYNHNTESIKFLIAQGLDVNAEGSTGNGISGNPLTCAIKNKNLEAVKELLRGGANPNSRSSESYNSSGSPFNIVAGEYKNNFSLAKKVIEALVEAGGNVNDYEEMTALDIAELSKYELEFAKYKAIFLPKNRWTSDNPFGNLHEISNASIGYLLATLTPLMYAVLNDNPDVVSILLDVGADAGISSAENKTALDYANEFFENSRLKKSPVFEKLRASTPAEKSKSDKNDMSFEVADKLVGDGEIPMYVRDKGKFIYNPEFFIIGINGQNVNLRSQPSTKSNVIGQLSRDDVKKWPLYLGEWISPDGEHWILGKYNQESYELVFDENKIVWISAGYAEPMNGNAYDLRAKTSDRGEELIDFVRNRMYYSDFSSELGYGPVGKQCEKFFSNGSWEIFETENKLFERQGAVFKGIAQRLFDNRRFMFKVFFNVAAVDHPRFKKGHVIISQINMNDNRVYFYNSKQYINNALQGEIFSELRDYFNMMADFTGVQSNQISLADFLEMIYRFD